MSSIKFQMIEIGYISQAHVDIDYEIDSTYFDRLVIKKNKSTSKDVCAFIRGLEDIRFINVFFFVLVPHDGRDQGRC